MSNNESYQSPPLSQSKPAAAHSLNLPSTFTGCPANNLVSPVMPQAYTTTTPVQVPMTSPQSLLQVQPNANNTPVGFLATKEESMVEDVQFLEARIASAKHEYSKLQQEARKHDDLATARGGRLCSKCHMPGHNKGKCRNGPCGRVSICNQRGRHPESKSEMTELTELIKSLEKRADKSRNDLLGFKAAREKAANSFFGIMRPRLKKQNAMKYAGTDRLVLDRDLLILKRALNGKVPIDEHGDWQLPMMIEEYKRKNTL